MNIPGISSLFNTPSIPPPPDYAAAAQATGASNAAAQLTATQANHSNMATPYGSLTYAFDPTTGQYNGTQTLSASEQALLTQQQQLGLTSGNMAQSQFGQLQNVTGNINTSGLPNAPQIGGFSYNNLPANPMNGMTAQNAIMSRLAPQEQIQQTSLNNQLANQGIMQGSQAYNNAQTQLGYQQTDANQQAALQGIAVDQQNRQLAAQNQLSAYGANSAGAQAQNSMNMGQYQQGLAGQVTQQNQAMNMQQMLSGKVNPAMPTYGSPAAAQSAGGTNYLGAAQGLGQYNTGVYNAQMGAQGQALSGLATLGAGYMMAPVAAAVP